MTTDRSHSVFDSILAEILQSEESGEVVSVEQWCGRYPGHEDAIRDFFGNREKLGLTHIFTKFDDSQTIHGESLPDGLPAPGDAVRYFGDYEVESELARGGMGVVYKAVQKSLGRTVALKMILAGELASEMHVARFRTEAEAAAQLDHPGIVPIYEIGEHNGQHYFSMAYVDGSSLAECISRGPLPPRVAAEIVAAAAEAVQYAHERHVVHRDLKPANILMDGSRPKITDFGLAKRLDQQSMTATGEVLGTPGYMAPEQAKNAESAGTPTDVYGLGAILYAAVTGRPPFQAANVLETLRQLTETEPLAPRQLNPAVPADLETICLAALSKEPSRRYATARDMHDDLRRFLEDRPIHARPVATWEHILKWARRRPLIAGLASALLLTIGTGSLIIAGLWAAERSARVAATNSAAEAKVSERDALDARERAEEQARIAEANLVTSRLSLADLMYATGQRGEAERHYIAELRGASARGDKDRRAWWKLWKTYEEHPRAGILPVGGTHVTASSDNRFIAVINRDTIQVLDGTSYQVLHEFRSEFGALARVEFSPDGKWLVANHYSQAPLLVWNSQDARPQTVTLTPPAAEISGTMKLLASSVTDKPGLAMINQLNNSRTGFGFGEEDTLFASGPSAVWQFELNSSDDEPVVAARRSRKGIPGADESMVLACDNRRLWITSFGPLAGVPLSVVTTDDNGNVTVTHLGIDGDMLIDIKHPDGVMSNLGLPITWMVLAESERAQLVHSAVFAIHHETLRLAVVRNDVLSVWDLRTGMRVGEFRWPESADPPRQRSWQDTKSLVFSPAGDKLATVGDVIRVVHVESKQDLTEFKWFGSADQTSVCFSADGNRLFATDTTDQTVTPPIGVYLTEVPARQWVSSLRFATVSADGTAFTVEDPTAPSLLNWRREADWIRYSIRSCIRADRIHRKGDWPVRISSRGFPVTTHRRFRCDSVTARICRGWQHSHNGSRTDGPGRGG